MKLNKIRYRSIDGARLTGIYSSPARPRAFALLLHGLDVDKDEWQGFYSEMAQFLSSRGVASFRFDFRGHGESDGTSLDLSVVGSILDTRASLRELRKNWVGPVSVIATSFGAGPAIYAAHECRHDIARVALIAPVIDYTATFFEPTTEWAQRVFSKEALRLMEEETGSIQVSETYRLSARLVEEFRLLEPYRLLPRLAQPVLLIHGDQDSMIPFEASRRRFVRRAGSRFVRIKNADHGFPDWEDEEGTSAQSLLNKQLIFHEVAAFVESPG